MQAFKRALLIFIVFSVLTGLAYPFMITGLCQVFFPHRASGSLIVVDGKTVGSDLIGQSFTSAKYFSGRPSATEKPYDAANSGASNFGPSNAKFLEEVGKRITKVRQHNSMPPDASVPADLVLTSGSGLDPDISLEAALLQIPRVAEERKMTQAQVRETVEKLAKTTFPALMENKRVNVLKLNLALDGLQTPSR